MKELDRQLYNEPENVKQYWKTRLRKRLEKRWKKEAENEKLLEEYQLNQASKKEE